MTETYKNENGDVLNFSTHGDPVLQHKRHGVEFSHITLHDDGPHVRVTRNAGPLKRFVQNNLSGFSPTPSARLKAFLRVIKYSI